MPVRKTKGSRIIMWPVWLLAIFTSAKSFRDNPVIGSRHLNRLGLHVGRVLLARGITWFRWLLLTPFASRSFRRQLHQNGFAVVENFISAGEIQAIRDEIVGHTGETRQMLQGNTATQRILLDAETLENKPVLGKLSRSRRLLNPLAYAAAKLTPPLLYIQRIRNGIQDGSADPQKTMHADTFHPTMKAWLFLEDVTPEKGPFTYVRGSHKMTRARLTWEYRKSQTAALVPDGYSEKGSFRAGPDDLAAMGLQAPEGICAKAGTLVIANTNGFHGRGKAGDNQSRLEVWAYARPSPFNPLPGLPSATVGKLQMAVLKAFWRRRDRIASKRNSRASWHLIDASEMTDMAE